LKFYAWIVPYNEGAPPGSWAEHCYDYGLPDSVDDAHRSAMMLGCPSMPNIFTWGTIQRTEFGYQTKFVHDHPEYQLVDREGKHYHYGNLEWAYPEAREYWLNDVKLILDKYDVDGIYMDTRTECMSPEHADKYGFNEPIVREFQKRYGVNILEEDFDVEKWRALRGEYFTLFLSEMSKTIHARGKSFCLGTSRGDYIGFPLGNMKLEWRKWISEKMIDALELEAHGWGWGKQGYGYLTDFATGRGLKPLEVMVREDYGPLCEKYGVRLYFAKGQNCFNRRRPLYMESAIGRAAPDGIVLAPDWCDKTAAMPEFSGTAEGAHLQ
jgi:hypothetical protein